MEAGGPKGSSGIGTAQDAILRFVVPADGQYSINATFSRYDQKLPSVTLSLRKNDATVWSKSIKVNDTTTYSERRTISCRRGDTLDFVYSYSGVVGWDWLSTDFTIARTR